MSFEWLEDTFMKGSNKMKSTYFSEAEKFRYLILASQRQGNRILNEMLHSHDITSSQAEVIRVLEEWEPISLKDLGNLLICESGSPSRLIERMVKDQLIQKQKHPDDSRYTLLTLTNKGKEKAIYINKVEKELYEMFQENFSEQELKIFNEVLSRFLVSFTISETLIKRKLLTKLDEKDKPKK